MRVLSSLADHKVERDVFLTLGATAVGLSAGTLALGERSADETEVVDKLSEPATGVAFSLAHLGSRDSTFHVCYLVPIPDRVSKTTPSLNANLLQGPRRGWRTDNAFRSRRLGPVRS